jgi:hypothetical protein
MPHLLWSENVKSMNQGQKPFFSRLKAVEKAAGAP